MKYHYQIVKQGDSEHVVIDTRENKDFPGYNSEIEAEELGEDTMRTENLDPLQYCVKIIPSPENLTEERMLKEDSINWASDVD